MAKNQRKNKWADWGLAIGIVIGWLGLPISIVGLVKSRKSGVGAGIAKAGIIVSAIGIILSTAFIIYSNRQVDRELERTIEELLQEAQPE